MTIEELAKKLVTHGAVLTVNLPSGKSETFLLAELVLVPGTPLRFKWAAIYPEDQHHIHATRYTRAVLEYDRDILFYDGGVFIASVVPLEEDFSLDNARESFEAWEHTLAVPGNRAQFEKFFKEN